MLTPSQRHLIFGILIALLSGTNSAEMRQWVTDRLSIVMRSGPGTDFQPVQSLVSGTAVNVLEINKDNGYSRIKVESGAEGWVLSRFLIDSPGSQEQLAAAKATIAGLTDESQPVAAKLMVMEKANADLHQTLATFEARTAALEAELSALRSLSSDSVRLDEDNHKLVASNQALQNEIDIMRAENERLDDKSDMEWFLNGSFAVAFGVFLALIIPRLRPRRRQSEWA